MRGQAAPFGATLGARGNASALDVFAAAYPRDMLQDTGTARLWDGPFFAPTEGTLDGWLLGKWFTSATSYDGIFFQNTSSSNKVKLMALFKFLSFHIVGSNDHGAVALAVYTCASNSLWQGNSLLNLPAWACPEHKG